MLGWIHSWCSSRSASFCFNDTATTEIYTYGHALSLHDALPICVDQEGERVQRFREGYSALPPLEEFGRQYAADPAAALERARQHAWVMASEVLASGVDLSFAPVVDLGRGNLAIGDRAFSEDPQVVAEFTRAYRSEEHTSGMAAPNKHSPGHGTVRDDPHFDAAPHPPT